MILKPLMQAGLIGLTTLLAGAAPTIALAQAAAPAAPATEAAPAETPAAQDAATKSAEPVNGRATEARRQAVESAIRAVNPALVRIHVVEASYQEGRSLKSESSGSGVIISPDGFVVTNHHVAGKAVRLVITMPDGQEIAADLIGTDPMSDIAVIKLKPGQPREFPFAQWGDSDSLRVGDPVLAMGSPLSLSQSVTEGIVSNTRLTMPSMFYTWQFELDGENVGSIVRWIGHDAAIYPGNSGGPLINLSGEVIGINEISMGLAGAIPGNLAREVAEELIKHGKVERAFVGFQLRPIMKHQAERKGAIISDVVTDSPAQKADIQPGDRLLEIRVPGQPDLNLNRLINVQYEEELPPVNLYLASLPIGKPVEVVIQRKGETLTKQVTPVSREPVQTKEREFKNWGITGRNLSIWTALEMKRKTRDGVLVTSVRPGGPAGQAKPDIEPGDILVKVGDRAVASMDELNTVTRTLTEGKDEPVPTLVTYARRNEEMMTVVSVGIDELDDPGRDVRKAWVPVTTQVLTRDLATQLVLEGKTGVRVTQVYEEDGEETQTTDLKVGDVILAIDGNPVEAFETQHTEVFQETIRQYKIGSEVKLSVVRAGQQIEVPVTLPARPPQAREMKRYQDLDFDFTVRNVAYLDRKTQKWGDDTRGGVMVDSVQEGGWAALGRLGSGDLLLTVNGEAVNTVDDVRQKMEKLKEAKPESVVFMVRRGIHTVFVEIEPLWDQLVTGS